MGKLGSNLAKQKKMNRFNTLLVVFSFVIIGCVNSYKQNKWFDVSLCLNADFVFTQATSLVTTVATRKIEKVKVKTWWEYISALCIVALLIIYGAAVDSSKSVITQYIIFVTVFYVLVYCVENHIMCHHFELIDKNGANPNDLGRHK